MAGAAAAGAATGNPYAAAAGVVIDMMSAPSIKQSGAGASGFSFAGLSELQGEAWDVGQGATSQADALRWAVLGGVVLIGLIIIKKSRA